MFIINKKIEKPLFMDHFDRLKKLHPNLKWEVYRYNKITNNFFLDYIIIGEVFSDVFTLFRVKCSEEELDVFIKLYGEFQR